MGVSAKDKLEYLKKIYKNSNGKPVSNKTALAMLMQHFPGEIDQHNDLLNNQQRLKATGYIRKSNGCKLEVYKKVVC